mmetsp:Transcript_12327/g.39222  ORF Transcript_12327/g.39222 Transcript_12327/m.39222 type:complete len:260 (+) Transcript_12327:154-933(+)
MARGARTGEAEGVLSRSSRDGRSGVGGRRMRGRLGVVGGEDGVEGGSGEDPGEVVVGEAGREGPGAVPEGEVVEGLGEAAGLEEGSVEGRVLGGQKGVGLREVEGDDVGLARGPGREESEWVEEDLVEEGVEGVEAVVGAEGQRVAIERLVGGGVERLEGADLLRANRSDEEVGGATRRRRRALGVDEDDLARVEDEERGRFVLSSPAHGGLVAVLVAARALVGEGHRIGEGTQPLDEFRSAFAVGALDADGRVQEQSG